MPARLMQSGPKSADFATGVRLQIEGALAKTKGNLTHAAVRLNDNGHRSAAGKLTVPVRWPDSPHQLTYLMRRRSSLG
jgi:hypothetical protein